MSRSMTCNNDGVWQTCRMGLTDGSFQAGFCGPTAFDELTSVTIPGLVSYQSASWSGTDANMYAPLIQLNWKASDLSGSSPPTSTSLPGQQTLIQSVSPSSSPAPSIDQDPSGLSTGGKIAVGLAVPLGVMAISFLAFFVWFRNRRRRNRNSPIPSQLPDGKHGGYRNAGHMPGTQFAEAEAKSLPQELPTSRSVRSSRHELMGREMEKRNVDSGGG